MLESSATLQKPAIVSFEASDADLANSLRVLATDAMEAPDRLH